MKNDRAHGRRADEAGRGWALSIRGQVLRGCGPRTLRRRGGGAEPCEGKVEEKRGEGRGPERQAGCKPKSAPAGVSRRPEANCRVLLVHYEASIHQTVPGPALEGLSGRRGKKGGGVLLAEGAELELRGVG